jgi:hypothetical protein
MTVLNAGYLTRQLGAAMLRHNCLHINFLDSFHSGTVMAAAALAPF